MMMMIKMFRYLLLIAYTFLNLGIKKALRIMTVLRVVVDTLKIVDPHRKCYRMVGGILCERTVQEIMPVLLGNKDQLMNVIKSLKEQLSKKGSEINDYKKKYKIRIKMQDYKQKQENFTESKRNAVVVL
ncbi:prefoldin subunit 2 isoform X3 [Phymastichus coffea]|uniref:prefoldin subunit 2 isoform X3 n=1 Tax=Phymastichus coffea TaxID=108790 RepID=UPI00273C0162|nr:prefoldin subunit 2 isoform X3 [Phymastichus coffea]